METCNWLGLRISRANLNHLMKAAALDAMEVMESSDFFLHSSIHVNCRLRNLMLSEACNYDPIRLEHVERRLF